MVATRRWHGVDPPVFDARLTVVTSAALVEDRGHRDVARAAVVGGADCVQLRAPELDDGDLLCLAAELAAACRRAGVLFIVNDRVEVALWARADGVHLGQADHPDRARAVLSSSTALGVSVETAAQARRAERFGATYLGVTVWSTGTKLGARPVGLAMLGEICAATTLPVVGIGGISASNAAHVLKAGARGIAVVSAVGAAADMVGATRALAATLEGRRR